MLDYSLQYDWNTTRTSADINIDGTTTVSTKPAPSFANIPSANDSSKNPAQGSFTFNYNSSGQYDVLNHVKLDSYSQPAHSTKAQLHQTELTPYSLDSNLYTTTTSEDNPHSDPWHSSPQQSLTTQDYQHSTATQHYI